MIVNYDKEIDMVYISKQINDRWVQIGFTHDEVNQIVDVSRAGWRIMNQRFKLVETPPDKNGFVIIAIKPDEHGEFDSREDAMEYLHTHHGKVPGDKTRMMMAKCHNCGVELIAPYDGQPYWCTECSYEDDLKRKQ